jgi:cbb3-type cytochrome oxidase subunit 3
MTFKQWLYFGFTALLTAAFAGIMIYYFRKHRKDRVESPKHRMLEDDDEKTSTKS